MVFTLVKKRSSNSRVLVVIVETFVCLLFASALSLTVYVLIEMETTRLHDVSSVYAEIPILDKDGLKYFIGRQSRREVIENLQPAPAPTTVPLSDKKI